MLFKADALPYKFDALEPYFDAKTMEIHYEKHYKGYISKLNDAKAGTEIDELESMHAIWERYSTLPSDLQTKVNKFGGGYTNHYMFWMMLSPEENQKPSGKLKQSIDRDFGSYDAFKSEFSSKAAGLFGSGWAWLVWKDGKFTVQTTANQEFIGRDGVSSPYLALDVWEHAYYLKYQNKRPDYIEAFFNIINWNWISEMFEEYNK